MVNETFYVKRNGKYIPVGSTIDTDCWTKGSYLVRIRRGGCSIRTTKDKLSIDAARIELAMSEMADAICWALGEVDKITPVARKNTELEQKAFEAYKAILGDEPLHLSRASRQEVADMAMRKVREVMTGQKSKCPKGCMDIFAEKVLGVK